MNQVSFFVGFFQRKYTYQYIYYNTRITLYYSKTKIFFSLRGSENEIFLYTYF